MKNILLLAIYLVTYFTVTAQENQKYYFNENDEECPVENAFYYKIIESNDAQIIEREYYISNNHLKLTKNSDKQGNSIGLVYEFYPDSSLMSIYKISEGRFVLDLSSYFPNGQKQEEISFRIINHTNTLTKDTINIRIENSWDSLGNTMVKDGQGIFRSYYSNLKLKDTGLVVDGFKNGNWEGFSTEGRVLYRESYENGYLIDGMSFLEDGTQITYNQLSIQPEPAKGLAGFYKYISKNLKYPKSARKNDTQGIVFVQFGINKQGQVVNTKILKGLSADCDAVAIEVIKNSPNWKPGMLRGRPVNVRMILPITFKLS
ncbi:MAG: TonB family protein [Reichenbachiella sp.]|uniref:TonB family protein n=1 Tax=Reichenbachiella sp. TaxID=2184521 RepID=UPI00329819D0